MQFSVFENYRKTTSLGSHGRTAIKSGDRVAHRGCIDGDWQLYEDEARSDFDVFLKACGISHGEGAHVYRYPTLHSNNKYKH